MTDGHERKFCRSKKKEQLKWQANNFFGLWRLFCNNIICHSYLPQNNKMVLNPRSDSPSWSAMRLQHLCNTSVTCNVAAHSTTNCRPGHSAPQQAFRLYRALKNNKDRGLTSGALFQHYRPCGRKVCYTNSLMITSHTTSPMRSTTSSPTAPSMWPPQERSRLLVNITTANLRAVVFPLLCTLTT